MRNNEITEKFSEWKQKAHENVDEYICITALLILFVIAAYSEISYMNQIRIVENPTFTGEVVNKEIGYFPPWRGAVILQSHQLHIVGEYFDGEKTIEIDRIFKVSRSWYNRFEVGDLIFHAYTLAVEVYAPTINNRVNSMMVFTPPRVLTHY